MRKTLLIFFFLIIFITVKSQVCNKIFVGNDTTVSCAQPCFTLRAKIPDIRNTSDYKVVSTSYQPYSFTSGTPITDPASGLYIDDQFSDSINMTFPFCFYGATYSKCTIGSNGVITFDVVTNTNKKNAYLLNNGSSPIPIPYSGGSPNTTNTAYYPSASIMGAYHDMDPSPTSNPPLDVRIEYSIVGATPCRKFIVTYYKVPMWSTMGSCSNLLCTQQIILNESTGIIDIYFENKPVCPTWQTAAPGLAILGVQNFARDKAVAAPGKNATQWTARREGYSFIPSGGASLLNRVELYKNGVFIKTGIATPDGNGQFDVDFPSVCQSETAVNYVVKAFYKSCSNPLIETEASDTISVTKTAAPLTASVTGIGCSTNTGTITILNPIGNPFEYSIDGLGWQASPTFVVPAGTYTVQARNSANPGCIYSTTVALSLNNTLQASASTTNSNCGGGSPTGTITVNASLGTPPYTYSLNSGTPQTSNIFTALPAGSYPIRVKDATGCTYDFAVNVAPGTNITASAVVVNTSCNNNNGSITVTPLSGTGPYQYSICASPCAGGTFQSSNIFTGLAPGDYSITAKDLGNCSITFIKTVGNNGGGTSATATSSNTACNGAATGTITVTTTSGTAPFSYSLNGGAPQTNNVFTGLTAGSYTIVVTEATGCTATVTQTVSSGSGFTAASTSVNTGCGTAATGSITITPSAGISPYTFSLNGGAFQVSNTFTGLAAGNYTIIIKDAAGCSFTLTQNVASGGGITAASTSVNTACGTASTGSITVTPIGTAPFSYSLNGGAPQASNLFNGLAAGSYSILITDANICTVTIAQAVATNPGVTATASTTNTACGASSTGTITVSPSAGVSPYIYSINGGAFQPSNIFTGLGAGTYLIAVKDAVNCIFNLNASVNNDPFLTATLSITEPSCIGTSTGSIMVNALLGMAPYQYALNSSAYQAANTFTNLAAGSYVAHIKDAAGCIKDSAVILNQPNALSVIADTSAATCAGNDGNITLTVSGGTAPYLYSKDNGANFQSSNNFKVNPGNYNAVVKDTRGCLFNTTAKVTLIDNMFLNIGNDTTSCFGIPITITPVTNSGTNVFNWTPKGGNLNPNTGAYTVSPSDTTIYFLTASYGVCQRSDNVNINVLRKPVADAGIDTIICDRTTAFLHGSASNLSGTVNYLWTPANDLTSANTDTTTAMPASNGPHTYTLQISDNYGCNFKVTDAVTVTVNVPPPAFAGNDTIAVMNLPHQLSARGGINYVWSPGGVLNNPFIKNPVAILANDTRFYLRVTDNAGCVGYDTVNIKVYAGPAYYIPNAFTPNGDGLNDVFRAIPPGIVKTDYFRIFNRWGQMLFETHQYMKGWDGTFVGKPQPNGVYVWMIKGIDKFGKVVEMRGTVTLIK